MEERLTALEQRVDALTEALVFAQGKTLGLEASMLTLAREWGNEPQAVIEALHRTMEVLESESGPDKPSGAVKVECPRVIEQVSSVLHSRNR